MTCVQACVCACACVACPRVRPRAAADRHSPRGSDVGGGGAAAAAAAPPSALAPASKLAALRPKLLTDAEEHDILAYLVRKGATAEGIRSGVFKVRVRVRAGMCVHVCVRACVWVGGGYFCLNAWHTCVPVCVRVCMCVRTRASPYPLTATLPPPQTSAARVWAEAEEKGLFGGRTAGSLAQLFDRRFKRKILSGELALPGRGAASAAKGPWSALDDVRHARARAWACVCV